MIRRNANFNLNYRMNQRTKTLNREDEKQLYFRYPTVMTSDWSRTISREYHITTFTDSSTSLRRLSQIRICYLYAPITRI